MPGVAALVDEVRLEVLLGDGTRLVVLLDPLGGGGPGRMRPARSGAAPAATPDAARRRRPATPIDLTVRNTSTRVVRVSSHYPFERVNPRLVFDRAAAAGFRLGPAGGLDRALGARRDADRPARAAFGGRGGRTPGTTAVSRLSPEERLARYGPTTGDRVRLGDTDLWVRVEEDRQAPGDEPIWGYAKTIRPRSTQGRAAARRSSTSSSPARSSSTRSSAS